MDYNKLLNQIAEQYQSILGKNLTGIYVHGSIAFGCFSWDRSDIDFLVVINEPISRQTKFRLLQVLTDLSEKAPPKGFEMSVVLRKYCEDFIYPTPFELHFSSGYLENHSNNLLSMCYEELQFDPDLAAHFMIITKAGIVLCGEEIAAVFGEVPETDYLDSIYKDVENAAIDMINNPVYIILNLCRVLAYVKEGLILSKERGGQWGINNLPEKYRDLISRAIDNYVSGVPFISDMVKQTDFTALVDEIPKGEHK